MQDVAAANLSDDSVEQLINHMRHGIATCPFPADRCVYCDRDTRCILLLQELLTLRQKAGGLSEAA
jgi:hypothetical protein